MKIEKLRNSVFETSDVAFFMIVAVIK